MNLFQENVNLKEFNTFGVNARARYFAAVHTTPELAALLSQPLFKKMPKFILGGGSNILFVQDFPGLVIKNNIQYIRQISEDENSVCIEVGAGENWHHFVMYCVEKGYAGIENLSLIPGTVGAAPIQNIGAYGVELCDVFIQLQALHLETGDIRIFTKEECCFGYRDSIFKNADKDKYIILSVTIRLNKNPIFYLDYGNVRKILEEMQIKNITVKAVSDAIIRIRNSKLPDPKQLGNAGSFFKNPIIPLDSFINLQKKFPNAPYFPTNDVEKIKISAGWLIEQCGWKGKRFGNIGVYEKQALIIVNYGAHYGKEIKELAQKIQLSVEKEFGINLIPEVNFV